MVLEYELQRNREITLFEYTINYKYILHQETVPLCAKEPMISNVIIVMLVTLQTNEGQPSEAPKVLLYNQQNHISEGIR